MPLTETVSIDYAASGGEATQNEDYTLQAETLDIPAGETAGAIELTLIDDGVEEANETIVISLSNPTNAALATSTITVTVVDSARTIESVYLPLVQQGISTR